MIKINIDSYGLNAHFLPQSSCLDIDVLNIAINKIDFKVMIFFG